MIYQQISLVMLFGGLGALVRLLLINVLNKHLSKYALGIVAANTLASFIVGYIALDNTFFSNVFIYGFVGALGTLASIVSYALVLISKKEYRLLCSFLLINTILGVLAFNIGFYYV